MIDKVSEGYMANEARRHPLVAAVVGMAGTGKSMAVRYLERKFNLAVIYFGGVVIEEIKRRRLVVTEANEAEIRFELRKMFGMSAMAANRLPEINAELDRGHSVVIDGLYSYSEYLFLQEQLESGVTLIAIHAPKKLRLQRLSMRQVRPLSPDEVELRDRREIVDLEKGGPIAIADYHVVNAATEENFYRNLDAVMEEIEGTKIPEKVR